LNVLITIDVEIWCDSWQTLEADFPRSFERYVFGRSRHGSYALPKTLEILERHALKAVFFVEPLFAARFGSEHLATIVDVLRRAGQEIQLHLHPEWTDESRTPLLPDVTAKRQHLSYYSLAEQRALIGHGLRLLREVGVDGVNAFRAGSFACNGDTFRAVADNGLAFDSSLNPTSPVSAPDLDPELRTARPFEAGGVGVYPMSVFLDGFGTMRHAQLGACSYAELQAAIVDAGRRGWNDFVLLSHNFELMKQDSAEPDRLVVKRFEKLARFLADNRDTLQVKGFRDLGMPSSPPSLSAPRSGAAPTAIRYCEQLARRVAG
jgi:hypothetical protein